MTNTDDIAEKVSDLLLEQTVKGGAFVTRAVPPAVTGIMQATTGTIQRLRQQIKNDKELSRLMGLEGEVSEAEMNEAIRKLGLVSSTIHVADADAGELADLLDEKKVLFAQVDKTDDNCKLFVFLTRDAEKVQQSVELMHARRGLVTELSPALFFNSLHPDKVREMNGLNAAELELFRHYARKEGLVFTVLPSQEGRYSLYFDAKEAEKARSVFLHVGWMLSGPRREQMRQQLEYHLAGRNSIQMSLQDAQRELFIVSATNPSNYVHITEQDFTQYKNGKSVFSVQRSRGDFAERCMAFCDGLEHPVVLAPDDFRTDLTVTDMSRYPTMDFMAKGFEEARETEKLNELIDLVSRKSGLDDDHSSGVTLWDSSVSFSDFASDEAYSDDAERSKAREDYERFQSAMKYSDEHLTSEELDMDQKNLDFIIYRAEQKRRAQAAGPVYDHEQERGSSYSL